MANISQTLKKQAGEQTENTNTQNIILMEQMCLIH